MNKTGLERWVWPFQLVKGIMPNTMSESEQPRILHDPSPPKAQNNSFRDAPETPQAMMQRGVILSHPTTCTTLTVTKDSSPQE